MSKTLKILSVAALAVTMALPANAQDTLGADTVVATVNGEEITLGHLILSRAALPEEYAQIPAEQLFEGLLNQSIQQLALSQSDGAQETRRVRLAMENERRALLASEVLDAILSEPVSQDALQAAYDARYADFTAGTEYNASHILVETEEEAQALVADLEGGADFATLAQERSTGPSGPSGGVLGWFSEGMMVQPFQDAVAILEPETISGPVQTQFGWHVIRLNETREKGAPALEMVSQELTDELLRARAEAAIDEIAAAADVNRVDLGAGFDPTILTQLPLLGE